jgi:hypothetical protein
VKEICLRMNCTGTSPIGDLEDILDFRLQSWCWNELKLFGLLRCNECILHVRRRGGGGIL